MDITPNPRLLMRKPGFTDSLKLLGITLQQWWDLFGRYYEARFELATLRVAMARIAQKLDLDEFIPGGDDSNKDESDNYQGLWQRASNYERGWNSLAAIIADGIVEQPEFKKTG